MLTDNNFEKRPTPPLSLRMAGLFPNPLAALYMMLGDIVTLLLFVYIGQADHELIDAENPVRGLLLASLPFIITWLVTSTVLGAYRVSTEDLRWRVAFWRLLNAWLVAAPLGIVLRAVWLDRAVIPTAFVLAALGFGGLMLLIWRAAYILVWRSRHQGRQQVG